MITYTVYITVKISIHRHDLGDKGQGHIYLKAVIGLKCELLFHFGLRVFIFRTMIYYGV